MKDMFGLEEIKSYMIQPYINIIKPGALKGGIAGLEVLANVRSIVNADENISYVVDNSGNKLPKNRQSSLMNDDMFWFSRKNQESPTFNSNLFNPKNEIRHNTILKTEFVNINGKSKKSSKLNYTEGLYDQFINQYYILKRETATGREVGFQPTVYSDKSNIWLKFIKLDDIDKQAEQYLSNEIKSDFKSGKINKSQYIQEYYFESMKSMMDGLARNIYEDYKKFFNGTEEYTYDGLIKYMVAMLDLTQSDIQKRVSEILNLTQSDIQKLVNEKIVSEKLDLTQSDIQKLVKEKLKEYRDFKFVEELHYSSLKGNTVLNHAFLYNLEMYLNSSKKQLFYDRITRQKALYALTLQDAGVKFRVENNINAVKNWTNIATSEWINFKNKNNNLSLSTINDKTDLEGFELNPELDEFFIYDSLISDHYNTATFGLSFLHPSKINTFGTIDDQFKSTEEINPDNIYNIEAAQTTAMYKRAVAAGATLHPFLKGLTKGVSDKFNFAIMQDLKVPVINSHNAAGDATAHDGGIIVNPIQMELQQNSLGELKLSPVHIKPFGTLELDNYMGSVVVKCAGTNCNNNFIRLAQGHQSGMKMMKLMNSGKWKNNDYLISRLFNSLYYLSPEGKIIEINSLISNDNGTYQITKSIDGIKTTEIIKIDNNYDLWINLGGAYSCDKNGLFNNNSITEMINFIDTPNHFIKTSAIHYLCPSSAVKQGITNLNNRDVFNLPIENIDNTSINSFSTFGDFFGIQLNAEHDVDDSHVSESTQQLAGLTQKGYSMDEANEIYGTIADLIYSTLNAQGLLDLDMLNEDQKLKIYRLVTNNLVKSLQKEGDSIGLTESILNFIRTDLERKETLEDMKWKLPFDDMNLYNKFVSSFQSDLSKNIIKRTTSGIAAVLGTSHDMVTVYETNNNTITTHSDLYKSKLIINDEVISNDLVSILKPGDSISIEKNGNVKSYTIIGFSKNDKLKQTGSFPNISLSEVRSLRNNQDVIITKLKSKGRNLRGYNNTITLEDGSIFDLYDLDICKLSYDIYGVELVDGKYTHKDPQVIKILNNSFIRLGNKVDKFKEALNAYLTTKGNDRELNKIKVKQFIELLYQEDLNSIEDNKQFRLPISLKSDNIFGTISKIDIQQNEAMIGRL